MSTCQVTWILPNERQIKANVAHGISLMLAATFEGVPGIEGDCGGCLSCATCHVVVDEHWVGRLDPISNDELGMLDNTEVPRQPRSRLSCQILACPALDGLVLHIPAL